MRRINDRLHVGIIIIVIVIVLKMAVGVVVVGQCVLLQVVRSGETFPAVFTPATALICAKSARQWLSSQLPVFPLSSVYPEVPVKFVRPGKFPGAACKPTNLQLSEKVEAEPESYLARNRDKADHQCATGGELVNARFSAN